ncbi:TPA: hypothetical protein N0F65_007306 [Lagenidium giganteum]|uniref:RRM domain-containing protein n=1 Tax=Lagenidium giganteum TaxID=4803 RepID=A0AAV2Z7N5_9STRA|nr:TPA: hypothetical protein N0F65_007306 [Lagenidium giganteum]
METECKTLWMGDIQPQWDEAFIGSLFAACEEQPVIKLIRDKVTGYPSGYGFLEFPTQRGAQYALDTFNGQPVSNTAHRFRLNWGAGGRRIDTGEDFSVFVGDLAPDVTDDLLLSTFATCFANVRNAKVVLDPITRMSKGFGFVRFSVKEEAEQALQTMNGVYCSSRPMRVSVATDRGAPKPPRAGMPGYPAPYGMGAPVGATGEECGEVANTTVFVGGLEATTTEDDLRVRFAAIGDIVSVKVPPGRGCGFVQYVSKEAAEVAIAQLNGVVINGVKIRCAWGRSAAARAAAATNPQAASYYQQYPAAYQQQAYQNYYGGYSGYYQQAYQQPAAYGYGAAAYGYGQPAYQHQPVMAPHAQYQHANGSYHQEPARDFTQPDDVAAMNRRYASRRAYQHMPPAKNAAYKPMASDVTKGTAMAGST